MLWRKCPNCGKNDWKKKRRGFCVVFTCKNCGHEIWTSTRASRNEPKRISRIKLAWLEKKRRRYM